MTVPVSSRVAVRLDGGGRSGHSATVARWGWLLVAVISIAWSSTAIVDFRVALGALLAVGFGLAVIGLRYPLLGLLGIGMLCVLNEMAAPLLLTGGLWRWNTFNYWLLLVALLFLPYSLRWGRLQRRVLVPLILLLTLEILLSPDPLDGVQHVFSVVVVFGLLIYVGRASLEPEAWYWLGVVSGVLAAGACAAFLLQESTLPYVNRNVWSYVPVTAILAICLAFVGTGDVPVRRLVLALLAVLNSVWTFLSASRGSFLIAAVCLVFLLTMAKAHRALLFGSVATLLSVVILSQFATLQNDSFNRLGLLLDSQESPTRRTNGRFDLALGGWYIFEDHPLGSGTGGFRTTWADLGPRDGLSRFREGREMAAHSGWIKVLAENGVPGILLLGAYVLSFTVSGWRARNPELLRLGLMVSAVLTVAWLSTEFQNKALWLLAAGATVLLEHNPASRARLRRKPDYP